MVVVMMLLVMVVVMFLMVVLVMMPLQIKQQACKTEIVSRRIVKRSLCREQCQRI